MCNLYSHTRAVDAMRKLFANFDAAGVNVPIQPGIFPDYLAPIIRNESRAPRRAMTRWGMPSSKHGIYEGRDETSRQAPRQGRAGRLRRAAARRARTPARRMCGTRAWRIGGGELVARSVQRFLVKRSDARSMTALAADMIALVER